MAETPAVSPFPAGDPRNAVFASNVAALHLAQEQSEAGNNRGIADATASYRYQRGQNDRQEPGRVAQVQNAANSRGLAESGTLAANRGRELEGYASRNQRLGDTRKAAIEKYGQANNDAQNTYNVGYNKQLAESTEQGRLEAQEGSYPPKPQEGGVVGTTGPAAGVMKGQSFTPGTQNRGVVKGRPNYSPQIRQTAGQKYLQKLRAKGRY